MRLGIDRLFLSGARHLRLTACNAAPLPARCQSHTASPCRHSPTPLPLPSSPPVSQAGMSSSSDPRTTTNISYFRPPPLTTNEERPGDIYALVSLVLGVTAMMLRNKYAAWATVFTTLIAMAHTRRQDLDWKQTGFSILFAILAVASQYTGIRKKQ